ncbi:chorismate mutase [Desulfoscipio gibsoniae]|uniref:chorismate mutase n=1 Tax=Desulfoscipio gibsoniae DSM 7213 TaxID=767817 RepID=R4KN13_9FIRM|nr:chorismate mutase [Desulfoscipio gibsoniae]AGL01955.1 monofunctional chorismate mutase, clade 1 [Desulfoscipio gibsoniae DSM 7213]
MRGIRGAITAGGNTEEAIGDAAQRLVSTMLVENNISTEDIASMLFTVTSDLNASFPAEAVRKLAGFSQVPMMCALEVDVPGSLRQCIRLMMLVNTSASQSDIKHIYLGGAAQLRPDLI